MNAENADYGLFIRVFRASPRLFLLNLDLLKTILHVLEDWQISPFIR